MFKLFDLGRDLKQALSSVNEVLTFNGTIFTGTLATEPNIKRYNHWVSGSKSGSIYQAMFSTNYSASTAVELMDITYGQTISSSLYTNAAATNKTEKNKIYKLFAKQLLGDEDSLFSISGSNRNELIFLMLKRSQFKDEIKKGSVSIVSMFSGGWAGGTESQFDQKNFSDSGAENRYSQTDRADVGNLITGAIIAGQIFYNAGIIVLVPELFSNTSSLATNLGNFWSGTFGYESMAVSGGAGTYENLLDGLRHRFKTMTVINQLNLQTSYYFCRAQNDEYNYSSNPSFLDTQQRIIPTSGTNSLQTRSYITKVALLGENQEILAVGSFDRPIKKSPDSEFTVKVRLDY